MELFPLFLKLSGRRCLVVGAGDIAESKIESLLRCGARVEVVAPEAIEQIRRQAQDGALLWKQRKYRPADLRGAFLVVAATSSPALHERIFRQARRAGILCNAVDEPARCDFYYPAVVRRGPLQIAISTSGHSPSLAGRIRRELEQELEKDFERRFPENYGEWVKTIGKARIRLLRRPAAPAERRALLLELSSEAAYRRFARRAAKRPATRQVRNS